MQTGVPAPGDGGLHRPLRQALGRQLAINRVLTATARCEADGAFSSVRRRATSGTVAGCGRSGRSGRGLRTYSVFSSAEKKHTAGILCIHSIQESITVFAIRTRQATSLLAGCLLSSRLFSSLLCSALLYPVASGLKYSDCRFINLNIRLAFC